jgi:hypothetical protein
MLLKNALPRILGLALTLAGFSILSFVQLSFDSGS